MLPEEENWLKELPPDFRPSQREIDQAYGLFGERNGIGPDLRILLGSHDGTASLVLRIIIDNRLCLFFYGDSGRWEFDGYECGDYENYWTGFDWKPCEKGRMKKTMFGWLGSKFVQSTIKTLDKKYRWRVIACIAIFTAALYASCEVITR